MAKGIVSHSNAQAPLYSSTSLNSAGSRWRLSLKEGMTESQAAACGEETDSRRTKEALSSNPLEW